MPTTNLGLEKIYVFRKTRQIMADIKLALLPRSRNSFNDTTGMLLERRLSIYPHIPKTPETCPCNACVFLRNPAYFPTGGTKKKANRAPLASNGVAPAAPTRASPASPVASKQPTSPLEMPQSVASTDPKIAAQQASDMRNIVRRKLTGYVGFANLPNQWHRKSVRKGFNFNVMVVGTFRKPLLQTCH